MRLPDLLPLLHEDLVSDPGDVDVARVARIASARGEVLGARRLLDLAAEARAHVTGLGPLEPLRAGDVTDLLVNADGSVWRERRGDARPQRVEEVHLSPAEARALAVRLATAAGRRLDDAVPFADARLGDGTRLHALLPPLSTGATVISLRFPARVHLGLAELTATGMLTQDARGIVEAIVAARAGFLVSGGTGTGKTTLLAAMLDAADPGQRILTVEDSAELDLRHPHWVALQARHRNVEGAGEVDLAALVRQCLRMRPDRIVVGECRGAEVRELLQALNTGHEGGCGTVHANTAADVPARLEALGALAGLDREALAAQAASALDLVLHVVRGRDGARRLDHIAALDRDAHGRLVTVEAIRFSAAGDALQFGPAWDGLAARLDAAAGVT